MEITVIHGQIHRGSTYHVSEALINSLKQSPDDQVNSFMLPLDGPTYCVGCVSCIYKGESYCPHKDKVKPIAEAILRSDVIIIDSPTYCLDMSGQLKTLFDHLGYIYMTHRPNGEMFTKIGVAVSTAAGAGAKSVTKSIAKQMFWWGVGKTYRLPFLVKAKNYQEVPELIKAKIAEKTKKLGCKIQTKIGHVKPGLKSKALFKIMSMMHRGNTWNPIDKNHWESRSWLNKATPWRG
ncbi:MAG: NAD(P)H-dependent oxidoreductase [Bacilli bacterium]|nr:NAD(P)H-dependent oxidoreductase [Bacilli bacterium]MBN2696981.1 NAD(P)H-dependent oxidoreductase [Bacilli bacterium]